MIRAYGLTKRYGERTVVRDLTFTVRPGTVTGFLGPNGAGKSTTMRMLLGLDAPTSGRATIGDRAYVAHRAPLCQAGALLEARSIPPGRTARAHLTGLAPTHGIPRRQVSAVIERVGLGDAADRRVKGFSLGMGQRLGIAAALLADPATVILDEPVNGLDPEGVLWIRNLLKALAAEGRTVFVSSHLMSEMALTAEHLIIIGRGRLLADTTVRQFVQDAGVGEVTVVSPEADRLRALLAGPGVRVTAHGPDTLRVTGADGRHIGDTAAAHALPIHELTPRRASLEEAFMELTRDESEYAVRPGDGPGAAGAQGACA
ncbi:ATP-binding cassette domain-containing protein [Streptomyces sp. HSW2009]|uniref:ATP-binding cassette domain-containing protein n=1 Tax=Streptomyces sp. HSW2009 TaxID=3142890 RepID=UPI0032ED20BA